MPPAPNERAKDGATPCIRLAGNDWPIPLLAPRQNRLVVPVVSKGTKRMREIAEEKLGKLDAEEKAALIAHVLLCMLAYYLQWHMRRSLAPMLFDEPDPATRKAQRTSPVAKAEPSPAAQRKAVYKRTDPVDGEPLPVHSFHTLLADLATLTRNVVRLGRDRLTAILATPTRTQHRALDLLGVTPTA
jgi:hypothetical protein